MRSFLGNEVDFISDRHVSPCHRSPPRSHQQGRGRRPALSPLSPCHWRSTPHSSTLLNVNNGRLIWLNFHRRLSVANRSLSTLDGVRTHHGLGCMSGRKPTPSPPNKLKYVYHIYPTIYVPTLHNVT